ncbi:unnamed protein product [marine sediment metagenome]|uniref:Uncharacterized protein n=1 Tax=marine sediment metagenome TaxID=412755 RepID=X0WWH7_9ZZZZ
MVDCNEENCPKENLANLGREYDPEHCKFRCTENCDTECYNTHNKEFSWDEVSLSLSLKKALEV